AHPDFLIHLIEGLVRLTGNFNSQSLMAANGTLLLTASIIGSVLVTLVALLVKYGALLNHKLKDLYSGKFSFPPAGWIVYLVLTALLVMRLGLAIYIAILLLVLWNSMSRKEKGVVLTLVVLLSACSFLSGYTNTFVPALDPSSVTGRLSQINKKGADEKIIGLISEIDDPRFRAEKDFALGTLMYRLENLEEAKRYLLESVSRRSDFAPAFLNLGNVYFKEGDFNKAIAGYQNVIALDSTNALGHFNIGQTYIKKMLFAQSSSALKKASELGIEDYRASYPSTYLRNLTIYDEGFEKTELWSIAFREGEKRDNILLSEILQPYLLFPFHWLGALLIASVIASILIGKNAPKSWKTFCCDNCGKAACLKCVHTEAGIKLCRSCSKLIEGLTSVKVMEALLRHRRQKISAESNIRSRCKTLFFPGAASTYHGKIAKGALTALINTGALMLIIWRGFYFKDPNTVIISVTLWKIVAPLVVLAAGYFISIRAKSPRETSNYWILPPEMRIEERENRRSDVEPETESKLESMMTVLNSVQEGSPWHSREM
ncbi:MAG: tetratricopeptide repeat protein, partial [Candidatus Krumholzibacteria bacterium]|nr:tetratricopeptide repeat protein [Candidatus Krumholzibacteria bacterium]